MHVFLFHFLDLARKPLCSPTIFCLYLTKSQWCLFLTNILTGSLQVNGITHHLPNQCICSCQSFCPEHITFHIDIWPLRFSCHISYTWSLKKSSFFLPLSMILYSYKTLVICLHFLLCSLLCLILHILLPFFYEPLY